MNLHGSTFLARNRKNVYVLIVHIASIPLAKTTVRGTISCKDDNNMREAADTMGNCLGIDIGGTSIKWALISNDYRVLERGDFPTKFASSQEVIGAIAAVAEPLSGQYECVGVSAPGGIDTTDPDGTIHRGGALTYMDGCPLGRELRERLNVPVAVINDGKACAQGEYAAGALAGSTVGVVLAIGTGIGGGVVLDGRVLDGAHCFASEFSFLLNNAANGIQRGANTFSTTNAWTGLRAFVLKEMGRADDPAYQQADGREIFTWIDAGDEAANRGLASYANLFAGQLFNLQCTLDPDVIAIAGGISCHDALIAAIQHAVDTRYAEYRGPLANAPKPNVVRATLGNDANLYGAAMQAFRLTA